MTLLTILRHILRLLEAFSFDLTSPEMILSKSNAVVILELGEDDEDIVNEVCDIYCTR
jgi:hypothetical protein